MPLQLPTLLISLEVDRSSEVNGSHGAFPATCARACFAGCIFQAYFSCSYYSVVYLHLELTVPGSLEEAPARAGNKNRPSKIDRMYAKKVAISTPCVLCGPLSKYTGFDVYSMKEGEGGKCL
jgi:hypothetical protein